MQAANSTAFAMALPTIGKEMQVEEARLQWIISAFPLSSVSRHRLKQTTTVPLTSVIDEYRVAYYLFVEGLQIYMARIKCSRLVLLFCSLLHLGVHLQKVYIAYMMSRILTMVLYRCGNT
jgi:hypothetical protein